MTETETGDELTDRRRKVPIRTKLLFSFGTLQEATVTAGGITTMLFYNRCWDSPLRSLGWLT